MLPLLEINILDFQSYVEKLPEDHKFKSGCTLCPIAEFLNFTFDKAHEVGRTFSIRSIINKEYFTNPPWVQEFIRIFDEEIVYGNKNKTNILNAISKIKG